MRWAALALAALALTGCETTAEKSAKLERAAQRRGGSGAPAQQGLRITRQSTTVKVLRAQLIHGSEGSAAVLTLGNTSGRALRDVPIAITVESTAGAALYANNAPGLSRSLVSAALLPAHGELTWVDDQIQGSGTPTRVAAKVGEAAAFAGRIPRLTVTGVHLFAEPATGAGAEGTIENHSAVEQRELVVYGLARRAGRIVAAGRAVLPQLAAGGAVHFQLFFLGDPHGAQLTIEAPPTTLG